VIVTRRASPRLYLFAASTAAGACGVPASQVPAHETTRAEPPPASRASDPSGASARNGEKTAPLARVDDSNAPASTASVCRARGFGDGPKVEGTRYAVCAEPSDGHFAWIASYEPRSVQGKRAPSDKTSWTLTHVDRQGQATSLSVDAFPPPDPCCKREDGSPDHALELEFPFDYDADGEPELLFLQARGAYDAGLPGMLVSAKGGSASIAYTPPSGYLIQRTEDVDGDERPDLVFALILQGDEDDGCGGYSPPEWSGEFLAHARPDGSFDLGDAVAATRVLEWCPQVPTSVETTADILCTRLWGARPAELRRNANAALRACQKERSARSRATDGCDPERCNTEESDLKWAQWQPPLTLDAKPAQRAPAAPPKPKVHD
jgi:hypothetical protein